MKITQTEDNFLERMDSVQEARWMEHIFKKTFGMEIKIEIE
jgi:hypothetical protein